MNIALGKLMLLVCLTILLAATAIITIYFLIYKRFINLRIQNRSDNDNGMPPPRSIFFATVCIALVLLVCFGFITSAVLHREEAVRHAAFSLAVSDEAGKADGYLSAYSITENAGYTRYIKEEDGIRYTYFLSYEAYDALHPAFLLFIEPTEDTAFIGYHAAFAHGTRWEKVGIEADAPLIMVGNAPPASVFSVTVYRYDKRLADEQNDESLALSHSSLHIALHE